MNTTQPNQLDRRNFLKAAGLTGTAFVLGLSSVKAAFDTDFFQTNAFDGPVLNSATAPAGSSITPFIRIDASGQITIMNPKPEIGQGTYQSIPALIAEELEVTLDQVHIQPTGGEAIFGGQTVGGSGSVRGSYMKLRKVGASAREMLQQAASQTWAVPVTECVAKNATIVHQPTGRVLTYGQLAEAAAKLPVPSEPKLKDPKDFTILGKSARRPDVPWKSTGKAIFGIDAQVPGMVYASVSRSPVLGSTLVSFDAAPALNVKGVQQVVKAKRTVGKNTYEGVAVVADHYWAALQGRNALKVKWEHSGLDKYSTTEFEQQLRTLAKTDGVTDDNKGDFDNVFAESSATVEAFYETPMVSHSPMEPMNCTAHWPSPDHIEVWVSTQGPDSVKSELANAFSLPKDNITVNLLFNGGGFGRRLMQDFAVEAADIAKAVGKPVKVIWTREDDTQLGPFRPMTFSAMRGAVSAEGKAVALSHKVIAPSIDATLREKFDKTKSDGTMMEGVGEQPYLIPNLKTAYVYAETHIPLLYWRAVTSTTLAFAHECFIDELAVKAGKDPMAFRLAMLPDNADAKRVLTKLREVSGWDKPLAPGRGRGVAHWQFFAGEAAQVVEVTKLPGGGVKIDQVYCVIDLGTMVNPDMVRSQVEGAIAMAITAATKDGIRFTAGQSEQTNFHNNQMLRINEMPAVSVTILADGGSVIKGVGEPGLPPLAPALANAIFAATGKRHRKMPFSLKES